jgi:hypothetical protein
VVLDELVIVKLVDVSKLAVLVDVVEEPVVPLVPEVEMELVELSGLIILFELDIVVETSKVTVSLELVKVLRLVTAVELVP